MLMTSAPTQDLTPATSTLSEAHSASVQVTGGSHLDEYRALDMPYKRVSRFSPRRYIRNCNPCFPSMNKANAVWMQAEQWGNDWLN